MQLPVVEHRTKRRELPAAKNTAPKTLLQCTENTSPDAESTRRLVPKAPRPTRRCFQNHSLTHTHRQALAPAHTCAHMPAFVCPHMRLCRGRAYSYEHARVYAHAPSYLYLRAHVRFVNLTSARPKQREALNSSCHSSS